MHDVRPRFGRASAAGATPTLGMILPTAGQGIPEATKLYPQGVGFVSSVVGLRSMTKEGYDAVLERIGPAARLMAEQGAGAVGLMGTSLSFYNGAAFNAELRRRVANASGLPALTMSDAVIDGLKTLGARRIAVATAYGEDVNRRLRSFLVEQRFEVPVIRGLGITSFGPRTLGDYTSRQLLDFALGVARTAPGTDAFLLSCGGLKTSDMLAPFEAAAGMPIVSSFPHGVRAGVRLLGLDGRVAGHGRLLGMR